MDNYNNILKTLFKKASEKRKEASKMHTVEQDCFSEEIFAAYLGDLLNNTEKEKVEEHLSNCKACRQNSIMFSRVSANMEKGTVLKAPSKLLKEQNNLCRDFLKKT